MSRARRTSREGQGLGSCGIGDFGADPVADRPTVAPAPNICLPRLNKTCHNPSKWRESLGIRMTWPDRPPPRSERTRQARTGMAKRVQTARPSPGRPARCAAAPALAGIGITTAAWAQCQCATRPGQQRASGGSRRRRRWRTDGQADVWHGRWRPIGGHGERQDLAAGQLHHAAPASGQSDRRFLRTVLGRDCEVVGRVRVMPR
jgi:hypothetical protein